VEFRCGSFGSDLDTGSLKFVIYTTSKKDIIEKELSEILDKLAPYLREHHIVTGGFKPTTRFFGYYETRDVTGSVAIMEEAAREVSGSPVKMTGACLSDLSLFLPYGSAESFNFGLSRDFSLYGGAHQPDEFVGCEAFLNQTKALILFLTRYCGAII
jgi:acetylornithine deacetylase/succinyl-diaminopimelate desuccinylase-like protein